MQQDSPNKTELISIVCVTYKRRDLVLRCLDSCARQDFPNVELVVVVNPSGDGTEQAIAEYHPEVKIICTHRNMGFFPALNIAVANASGDFIMIVDDDAYFIGDCILSELRAAFHEEPELGAVMCNLEGPHEVTFAGGDRYIASFKTGFTLLPCQVFTEWVGYFPDIFFRSAGERYLCTRLWDQGRRVKCLGNARMYHDQAREGRSDRDWAFYGQRSQILCVFMRDPWLVIPIVLASKFVRGVRHFLPLGQVMILLQAWLSALLHLPEALALRRPIRFATWRLMRRLDREEIRDPILLRLPTR